MPFWRKTPHATVTNVQADLPQLLCHSWTSVAAQTEKRLFLDMRQRDKIGSLAAAGRTVTECTQTARTQIHHATHASDRRCKSVFFDKLKPHGFWLAKNTVAFFKISRSSLRIRFSRRRQSFSWVSPKSFFDTTSVSRCAVIHLFSVDIPTPRSSATYLRVSPLVSAICTASLLNSSVRVSLIVHLLCCSKCYQGSGIKPRQVQSDEDF